VTPEQAAHETRNAVVSVVSGFMTDPATYARGAELGFEEMDFYVAGRGGVLGDVPAEVVAAAFVFFAPEAIRLRWERSAAVTSRRRAAEQWARWAHTWAHEHFPDGPGYERIAQLAGRIVHAAPVAGAPLFAGWRTLAEPADAKALALHLLNALRELRGAMHAAAVLTVGLSPREAIAVRTPLMLPVFGWTGPPPDTEPLRERWTLAEARTDRMLGRHFAVLDDVERKELVDALGVLSP
jgi:hypothetical protein